MNNRITIISGAFGSGKTEFALSYACFLKQQAPTIPLAVVDLDIINPYFRSRDVAKTLGKKGLEVVSSDLGLAASELPALSPRIYSFLQDRSCRAVFDVGGDQAGARALGRYYQYFKKEGYQLWLVVNPFRPDTRSLDQVTELANRLQTASRLRATGLVSNINLGPETTLELWREGLPLISALETSLKLPLKYHAVEAGFAAANQDFFKDLPVFPIQLRMLSPWLQ